MSAITAATPSRRTLLGMLAGTPFAFGMAAPALAASDVFAARLAEFHRLNALHAAAAADTSIAEGAYFACRPVRAPSVGLIGDTVESYNARVAAEKVSHEAADRAARDAHRLDWLEARQTELCCGAGDAFDELISTPAPTIAAVAAKLELAMEYGADTYELTPLLDDLRRLGGRP